jgi:hypothetical protein
MEQIANIARPCDVPDTGLLCDILWADPDPSITVSHKREAIQKSPVFDLSNLSVCDLPRS